jgi:hypothetical protein
VRLHPVEDGVVRNPDERGMTVRDSGGNRLIDVHNPLTGFCTGVTSPMTVRPGQSVIDHKAPNGGKAPSGADVLFSPKERVYYEPLQVPNGGRVGIVVRTCADADGPLPVSRIRIMTDESTSVPGKKRSVRKENDAAARAILAGMGWKGELTKEWREMALRLLAREKALQAYKDEAAEVYGES